MNPLRSIAGAMALLVGLGACGGGGVDSALAGRESPDAAQWATDKLGGSAQAEHARRTEAIEAEIARLGPHPWAGSYYEGDGLGENVSLEIAPAAGVALTWHGCVGLYDQNWGSVVEHDGLLRLTLELPNPHATGESVGFPTELLVVPWGERVYLVEPAELARFQNSVRRGREPRTEAWGSFLLRSGDEERAVTGEPRLPATSDQAK